MIMAVSLHKSVGDHSRYAREIERDSRFPDQVFNKFGTAGSHLIISGTSRNNLNALAIIFADESPFDRESWTQDMREAA
jgi:hypothetical protein